jgi:hypothetical protein
MPARFNSAEQMKNKPQLQLSAEEWKKIEDLARKS